MSNLCFKAPASAQSICIFCDCNLGRTALVHSNRISTRKLWTPSRRPQESGSSAWKLETSNSRSFSSLTPFEQARRDRLRRANVLTGATQSAGPRSKSKIPFLTLTFGNQKKKRNGSRPRRQPQTEADAAPIPNFSLGTFKTEAPSFSAPLTSNNTSSSSAGTSWNLDQTFESNTPPVAPAIKPEPAGSATSSGDLPIKSHPAFNLGHADAAQEKVNPSDSSNSWKHLRQRQEKSATPAVASQEIDATKDGERGDEWIDEAFERHRKEREQFVGTNNNGKPASNSDNTIEARSTRDKRKCARCGQIGHIARNCTDKSMIQRVESSNPRDRAQNVGVDNSRSPKTTIEDHEQREADARAEARARRALKFTGNGSPAANTNQETAPRQRRFEEPDRKAPRRNRRSYEDDDDDGAAIRDEKNAQKAARKASREQKRTEKVARSERRKSEDATPINLSSFMSVAQLAQALSVHYESFVAKLEHLGYDDIFPGKILNAETSGMIAMEFNFDPIFDEGEQEAEERDLYAQPEIDDKEFLPARPPVVTIMGHVDHGKTTILDYIRKSSVAAGEAGGITQHIGAFSVPMTSSGKTVTFLDTPGHAAFLAMRQRGANVTDIVILVVAADDSVKPQTLEAIKHAKAAGVPMIVAVNKVDKEEADVQRVKQDLARHQIDIEDYGGETQVVPVSGKTGQGMADLEETIVTLSEILDHRAPVDGVVEGWILEAETKKSGRVATVLVRRGTLRPGAILVAGKTWTRVRSLRNEGGQTLRAVGPGMPVEVDGWRDQPSAGDEVLEAPDEQKASDVVSYRLELDERVRATADMEVINDARRLDQEKRNSAETTDTTDSGSGHMTIPFIIKADVSGSAEAVSSYILSASHPMISPTILNSGVGQIFESDVDLAAVAGACIVSFNQPIDDRMRALAESKGVRLIENNIIYRVLDEVKSIMEDRLPPIITQRVLGEAEVSASFEIGVGGRKKIRIAGCKIRNGVVSRNARVRVMRKEQKVFDGTLESLKNVKKDVEEMRKGTECGMGFADWELFEVGDLVQAYEEHSAKRKL